ncbi:hypothetical protein QE372_005231 [Agrobacterium pusense]|nr:hypothetical protein [Agrobacterium pusense]
MTDVIRKVAWFIGLWLAGVTAVVLIGFVIRSFLN